MSKECQEIFTVAFQNIKNEIEYDRNWSNGTGFHDYAVYGEHAVRLNSKHAAKATSSGGRRIILIGTCLGTVAVFERYGDRVGSDEQVFVHNCTSAFDDGRWVCHRPLLVDDLNLLLGDAGDIEHNIGWRIEQIIQACKKGYQKK